jgi:hypothetical protein
MNPIIPTFPYPSIEQMVEFARRLPLDFTHGGWSGLTDIDFLFTQAVKASMELHNQMIDRGDKSPEYYRLLKLGIHNIKNPLMQAQVTGGKGGLNQRIHCNFIVIL